MGDMSSPTCASIENIRPEEDMCASPIHPPEPSPKTISENTRKRLPKKDSNGLLLLAGRRRALLLLAGRRRAKTLTLLSLWAVGRYRPQLAHESILRFEALDLVTRVSLLT